MAHSAPRFSPAACQPRLTRASRRARGVYYTPLEIVRLIVDLTLGPLLPGTPEHPLQILDPACGAGEFLVEAQRRLLRCDKRSAGDRLVGVDLDSSAVAAACRRLQQPQGGLIRQAVRVGDALAARTLSPTSFDVILCNPPYVNIRQLTRSLSRQQIAKWRAHFATAHGNFDLYVLFIERAIELLKPGGRCGLIVPNKWATLDYARPCRKLLLEQTEIEHVIDLSETKAFDAAVYPHVIIFRKQPAAAGHMIQCGDFYNLRRLDIAQHSLEPAAFHLTPAIDVESRVPTQPLGQLATLACGTAGYTAQKIAARVIDDETVSAADGPASTDFITSGNIDRYQIRLGNVRYLNRDYCRPKLPLDLPELTAAKRRLFGSPKILIAGLSRRLEAAWDDRGLALGVQVFAAHEFSTHEHRLDPFYLLALLNSKLLSYLFATRFAAKRLGGGYLAINKGQLARLPIRIINSHHRVERRCGDRLAKLAASWTAAHETQIDQLVYELYRLTSDEVARVEAHFAQSPAAAAA